MTEAVADRVEQQLHTEISAARAEHDSLDADLIGLQDAYDRAWADEIVYLRKGKKPPEAVVKICNKLNEQTVSFLDRQKALREKLARLSSPAEAERRLQDATTTTVDGLPRVPRAPREVKPTARERGVPDVYLGDNGNFRPGMDARYKSDLINSALGLTNENAKMAFDLADAEQRLTERGWTHFLDRKREKGTS